MLVDCVTLQLPKIHDPRGNLTFVEGGRQIPFDIRRVYYLYDVPGGSERGGHAHLNLHQFVIAMSGSFDIVLDDGFDRKRYHLNRSYEGLYIPPMTWRELDNFSSGSVCMVLASEVYDEGDYLRNYSDFMLQVHTRFRAQHHHTPPAVDAGSPVNHAMPMQAAAAMNAAGAKGIERAALMNAVVPGIEQTAGNPAETGVMLLDAPASQKNSTGTFDDELVLNIT